MTGEVPLEALFSTPLLDSRAFSLPPVRERASFREQPLPPPPPLESWGSAEASATTFPRASWSFLPSGNFHPWCLCPRCPLAWNVLSTSVYTENSSYLIPRGITGEYLSFFIRSFLPCLLSSSFSFPLPSFLPVILSLYSCILSSHSFSFHQALGHKRVGQILRSRSVLTCVRSRR